MEWKIRPGLFISWGKWRVPDIWSSFIRRGLLSLYTLHCRGEVKLAQVSVSSFALSQFPCQWARGDYLILSRWRMCLQFHIHQWLLPGGEHSPGKRQQFLLLRKLIRAETEEMTVISVTLYSKHISFVPIAECPSYLGVHVFDCISERMENVGVCMQRIVSRSRCASQQKSTVGRCELQGAE